jgi:hypothetical protein
LDSALRTPQWTLLRETDNFESGVNNLIIAIQTDFALMNLHAQLLVAADNWNNNNRNRSYLLQKDGLKEAEIWLTKASTQPDKLPQPTQLEVEYIFASQQARSRGTRIALGIALGVVTALSLLSVVALVQRNRAIKNAQEAEQQKTDVQNQLAKNFRMSALEARNEKKY